MQINPKSFLTGINLGQRIYLLQATETVTYPREAHQRDHKAHDNLSSDEKKTLFAPFPHQVSREHRALLGLECKGAFWAQVPLMSHHPNALCTWLTSKRLRAALICLGYKWNEVTQVLIKPIISRMSPLKMDMSLSKWHLTQRPSNMAVTTVAIKCWLMIMLIVY